MSSPGLPTLTIDVTARRGEHRIVFATVALVALAFWQWNVPAYVSMSAAAGGLLAMMAGYRALGWLGGGTRLIRIACAADDHWLLYEANGRAIPARLSPHSRIGSGAVWLRWDVRGRRPLVLFSGDIADDDFRRLLVRLRVASFRPGGEREATV